ncbi:MAG: hypothetical protein DBP02_15130 [gamma proteobacterium symbiont of Ctena orbiculata]|nr:MAG: hypothetical protein DBP02_15130 [gamma proteobacterium symbiont of Ctena orbiculata]
MAVLIDHTNWSSYLKESTQSRSGTPDGNVYFDSANNIIELIGVDELATFDHTPMGGGASDPNQLANVEGITLRGLYNFINSRRRLNNTLRQFKRGMKGNYRFAGAYYFPNGVKLDDTVLGDSTTDRNKIRGSGWLEYADTGDGETDIDRIYHGVVSLVSIQATTQPRYALVTDTLEATLQAATWADFSRVGDINETVQVFGDTANGDASAGDFDYTTRTLIVRVRSWGYNPGETTSVATGIAEFSGFSAGYGVGESLNPANTYDLADVIGGGQITPWTGMSLEKLVAPQTETGFNESDGDFTWVLHNANSGTAQECAAFLDALTLQDADVDDGAGSYNGQKGRVWYTRNASGKIVTVSNEGEGLFIEGLSTAEQQNVIMTDDTAATKTYPFFPDVQISVGAAAVADANAWYHVYYLDGAAGADFDTASAVTVEDSSNNPVNGNVNTDAVGNKVSFAYAYDTNTQAGLSAGVDKDIVVIVEGDGGVAQAITYATITRDTVVPVTCAPSADNNA